MLFFHKFQLKVDTMEITLLLSTTLKMIDTWNELCYQGVETIKSKTVVIDDTPILTNHTDLMSFFGYLKLLLKVHRSLSQDHLAPAWADCNAESTTRQQGRVIGTLWSLLCVEAIKKLRWTQTNTHLLAHPNFLLPLHKELMVHTTVSPACYNR